MKKCLWVLLNKSFKKDLELLYGIGSYVDILEVKKCTTNKKFLVDCKLYIGNLEFYEEIGNSGLNHLLMESWKYTGFDDESVILSTSYDVIL